MKDIIKLLLLVIPAIKDLVGSVDDEVSLGKKKRILRIMEDQDLTKLEKIERILLRKGGRKVEILGFVKDGKINSAQPISRGVVVNGEFIRNYYYIADKLKKKD